MRFEAIKLLKSRDVDNNTLTEKVHLNTRYTTVETTSNNYKVHAKFAIWLFGIGAALLILHFVFKNNKLPHLASASIQLSIVSFVLYAVYYIKSLVNLKQFYKYVNKPKKMPNAILLILGFPLYMVTYLFLNVKIKEDLRIYCLESLK